MGILMTHHEQTKQQLDRESVRKDFTIRRLRSLANANARTLRDRFAATDLISREEEMAGFQQQFAELRNEIDSHKKQIDSLNGTVDALVVDNTDHAYIVKAFLNEQPSLIHKLLEVVDFRTVYNRQYDN
jgi:hypothetical protein